MKKLRLESEGVVYRNSMPGYIAIAAVTPFALPMADGEVLAFYRKGQAFYSIDGVLALARSTDAGESWSEESPIWDPSRDDRAYSYSAPHCLRKRDATLLLTALRWGRSSWASSTSPSIREVTTTSPLENPRWRASTASRSSPAGGARRPASPTSGMRAWR